MMDLMGFFPNLWTTLKSFVEIAAKSKNFITHCTELNNFYICFGITFQSLTVSSTNRVCSNTLQAEKTWMCCCCESQIMNMDLLLMESRQIVLRSLAQCDFQEVTTFQNRIRQLMCWIVLLSIIYFLHVIGFWDNPK